MIELIVLVTWFHFFIFIASIAYDFYTMVIIGGKTLKEFNKDSGEKYQ